MNNKFLYFLFSFIFLCVPVFLYAQTNDRSYIISAFDVALGIKKDSTVDVVEKITYQFNGTYNKGWRSISLKDIDKITNISIIDLETNTPLLYTSSPLEKTNPANWGKYTVTYTDGYTNIEWYYDASNTQRAWEIRYTVHGLVGFYDTYDEIYWNVFTEYEVPISTVSARVYFVDIPDPQTERYAWYRTIPNKTGTFTRTPEGYVLQDSAINPYEAVTVSVGFPKDLISPMSYWIDFIKINWGFVSAVVLSLLTLLFVFIYWIFHEYIPKHNKSIVPQYDPPKNLKPAQMDLIYNEGISKKTWASTIVDLAVKGYLKIEEDEKNKKINPKTIFRILFSIAFVIVITISFIVFDNSIDITFGIMFFGILFIAISQIVYQTATRKHYIIHLKKLDYKNDQTLDIYEKNFLVALMSAFGNQGYFSTREMQERIASARMLYVDMQKIEKGILEELGEDYPEVYAKPLKNKNKRVLVSIVAFFLVFISIFIISSLQNFLNIPTTQQIVFLGIGILFSVILYFIFVVYNPKLSHIGNQTWRDIEGFKWYLKIAERYRMQNLTPELFEKYLPYAMIFGVEKKWAKHFDSIVSSNPAWYTSNSISNSATYFSVSTFATSFSTSFASAFAASGGSGSSGGSGGGGSAGGGGGGGGGGAS